MSSPSAKSLYFYQQPGHKCINWGQEGKIVSVSGEELQEKIALSKIYFYGPGGNVYAEIMKSGNQSISFKVPKLSKKGWYKIVAQTRAGWSNFRYFYYY